MNKTTIALVLLFMLAACGQKVASGSGSERENDEHSQKAAEEIEASEVPSSSSDFDFSKYQDDILEYAFPRYAKSTDPVRIVEYAFIDIDGDGQDELWVRGDEGQDYQGVFAIAGDSVVLLADADVRSEIVLYKSAVGYDGYYGDGRVRSGASIVRNSCLTESYEEDYTFNIFSDDQEIIEEYYDVNGKGVSAEECSKFQEQLGDKIPLPQLKWHAIEPVMRIEED